VCTQHKHAVAAAVTVNSYTPHNTSVIAATCAPQQASRTVTPLVETRCAAYKLLTLGNCSLNMYVHVLQLNGQFKKQHSSAVISNKQQASWLLNAAAPTLMQPCLARVSTGRAAVVAMGRQRCQRHNLAQVEAAAACRCCCKRFLERYVYCSFCKLITYLCQIVHVLIKVGGAPAANLQAFSHQKPC
jgi:hypothetical protein